MLYYELPKVISADTVTLFSHYAKKRNISIPKPMSKQQTAKQNSPTSMMSLN